MRGLPKFFNTKQDYFNCLAEWKEETKAELRRLLDSRFSWFDVKVLEDGSTGLNDDTHRVIDNMQQELKEDPNARIFQLGFTVVEIEELLND
jgi:hypothetical protein